MRPLDWVVLAASLVGIVVYGVWKGRRSATSTIPPRRPADALAPRRALDHGHAGAAPSPSSRRPARPTPTACASCSSTSACRSRWSSSRSPRCRSITGSRSTPPTNTSRPLRPEDAHARRAPLPRAARTLDGRHDLRAGAHPLGHPRLEHPRRDLPDRRAGHDLHGAGRHEGRGPHALPTAPHHHRRDVRRLRHGHLLLPADVSFVDAVRVAGELGRLNAIDFSFDRRTATTSGRA